MIAQIGGASYWVGSQRYLQERAQETEEINLIVNKARSRRERPSRNGPPGSG